MKKFIFFFVLTFALPGLLRAKKECVCGDYATGYHHYYVGDLTGCCSGTVLTNEPAYTATFAQEENGGWQLIDSEFERPHILQNHCCDQSK